MPNPHYERKWWSELPETAQEAALTLGYTQETWDADSKIPYDFQDFHECSNDEKESAMYLGLDPIKKKLDIWWDDTDKKTLAEAKVLGWSKETWDKDWQIEHLPCNKWYWDEMTSTQQKAARHFGYTKGTWDETWEVEEKKPRFANSNTNVKKEKLEPESNPKIEKRNEISINEEDNDDGSFPWDVVDFCCLPYKIMTYPAAKVASVVTSKA